MNAKNAKIEAAKMETIGSIAPKIDNLLRIAEKAEKEVDCKQTQEVTAEVQSLLGFVQSLCSHGKKEPIKGQIADGSRCAICKKALGSPVDTDERYF